MKKYINPIYETEAVEVNDIILTSQIKDDGQGVLGGVTGNKGSYSSSFGDII